MADEEEPRAKLLEGWVQTAARLVRAELPPNQVFETMTAVGVTGLLRTWNREEAAMLLRELADRVEAGQQKHVDVLLRHLTDSLHRRG